MSFNLDGTSNITNDSIINLKCDTIQGLSGNLVSINSQLDVNNTMYITGTLNVGNRINFSSGAILDMWGSGTITNISTINPSHSSPLIIDDLNNGTHVQINHATRPGLILNQLDNAFNWISCAGINVNDDNAFVFGSLTGQTLFGSHNKALNAWKDLYTQLSGNFNVWSASNVEKFNVVGNIRSDIGSFYKGSIDQFRYPKTKTISTQQITITSTTDILLTQTIYLGYFFEGNINNIYVAVNSNGNTIIISVKDQKNNATGSLTVRNLGTISNLPSNATVLSIYGRLSSAGTAYFSGALMSLDN